MKTPVRSRKKENLRNLDYDVRGRDIPRRLFVKGRIKFAIGVDRATDPRDRESGRRRAQFDLLRRWGGQGKAGAWEVLHGLMRGVLDPGEVANQVELMGERALPALFTEVVAKDTAPIPTVRQEADRYLGWYKVHRKDQSYQQVTSRLKQFTERRTGPAVDEVEPLTVGATRIDQLTKPEVEHALSHWTRGNSRNSIHGAAQGLFRWSIQDEAERARKAGELPRWTVNPAEMVEKADSELREVVASAAQVLSLFAAAELYQRAYLRAFVHLGMREAELIHTRFFLDLNTDSWIWAIQRRDPDKRCPCGSCNGKGWSPKVKRSHRRFHVPEQPQELRATIAEYLEENPVEPGDFVFRDPRGRMWTEGAIRRDFASLCRKADVRFGRKVAGGIVVHDLRATCITQLLLAGEDLGRVAALVGDSADTIMDRYFRPTAHEIGAIVSRGPRYALTPSA